MTARPAEIGSADAPQTAARIHSPLVTISGFAASLLLHTAAIFILLTWGVRGCGDGTMIVSEGESRTVNIYVKQPDDDSETKATEKTDEATENSAESTAAATAVLSQPDLSVSKTPPVETPLPESRPRIGPGGTPPAFSSNKIGETIKPNAIRSPAPPPPAASGPGDISFFEARDQGSKVVFVIDTSSSMYGTQGRPIQVALAELSASVQSLNAEQLFQIVFYESNPRVLNIRGARQGELYRAADYVKTLALQEVASVSTGGGTDHMKALRRALQMEPEILFLLTDAEHTLSAADLDEVRRLNRSRTRIHCIQFGTGSDLSGDSFLKQLAEDHGGTYRYRDVKKF